MEEGEVYLDHGLQEFQADNLADAENAVREVLFSNPLVAVTFTRHDFLGQLGAGPGSAISTSVSSNP